MGLKNKIHYSDKGITFIVILLSVISFIMIYSTWSITTVVYGSNSSFEIVGKQILFLCVSFALYIFVMLVPYNLFRINAKLLWIITNVLLVVVFSFPPINESYSWIPLGGFNFQPSELAKIATIFTIAGYYYKLFKSKNRHTFAAIFIMPLIYIAVPTVLIIRQPDPGTALVILFVGFSMIVSCGVTARTFIRNSWKLVTVVLMIFAILIAINSASDGQLLQTQSRMISRFDYKNPCDDFQGDGFQICNSLIAINTGGTFGKGIGGSTQKYLYLPESHTDAIIAVTAEELGLLMTVFILILYLALIMMIVKYATRTPNKFCSLTCVGIASIYFAHVFINIGGILNIIPFTGIPLPFYSYGGTFSLLCFGSLGVVQSIAISVNRERA